MRSLRGLLFAAVIVLSLASQACVVGIGGSKTQACCQSGGKEMSDGKSAAPACCASHEAKDSAAVHVDPK